MYSTTGSFEVNEMRIWVCNVLLLVSRLYIWLKLYHPNSVSHTGFNGVINFIHQCFDEIESQTTPFHLFKIFIHFRCFYLFGIESLSPVYHIDLNAILVNGYFNG